MSNADAKTDGQTDGEDNCEMDCLSSGAEKLDGTGTEGAADESESSADDSDESDEEDGPWHRTCCGLTEHERCPDACAPLPGQAVDGCAALCAKLPGLCKWLYESCAAGCAKSAKCLAENETTAKACPCLSSYAELDSEDEDDEEQGRRRSATAPARTGGSSKKGSAPRPQKMKAMA